MLCWIVLGVGFRQGNRVKVGLGCARCWVMPGVELCEGNRTGVGLDRAGQKKCLAENNNNNNNHISNGNTTTTNNGRKQQQLTAVDSNSPHKLTAVTDIPLHEFLAKYRLLYLTNSSDNQGVWGFKLVACQR